MDAVKRTFLQWLLLLSWSVALVAQGTAQAALHVCASSPPPVTQSHCPSSQAGADEAAPADAGSLSSVLACACDCFCSGGLPALTWASPSVPVSTCALDARAVSADGQMRLRTTDLLRPPISG